MELMHLTPGHRLPQNKAPSRILKEKLLQFLMLDAGQQSRVC